MGSFSKLEIGIFCCCLFLHRSGIITEVLPNCYSMADFPYFLFLLQKVKIRICILQSNDCATSQSVLIDISFTRLSTPAFLPSSLLMKQLGYYERFDWSQTRGLFVPINSQKNSATCNKPHLVWVFRRNNPTGS